MKKIVLSNAYKGAVREFVESLVPEGFTLEILNTMNSDELKERIVDADYLLVSGRMKVDGSVLSAAKQLKMVQRTGVGLDHIDLAYLKENNIPLYVNQGVNALSVAEHTLLLMLAVLKRLPQIDRFVKNGGWDKQNNGIQNHELSGKTIGIIGAGHIGRTVVKLLSGFDANVIYYDAYRLSEELEQQFNMKYVDLDTLLKESDVVSLHVPLLETTRHMINQETLAKMKSSAILVNTSRGPLIDENALLEALQNGVIKAAGIDVYESEPVAKDSPLLKLENLITTPHIAGITRESFGSMISKAFDNMVAYEQEDFASIEPSRYPY